MEIDQKLLIQIASFLLAILGALSIAGYFLWKWDPKKDKKLTK